MKRTILSYIFPVLFFTVLLSCSQRSSDSSSDSTAAVSTPASSTVLTEQQKADGWKALFDGKSLAGWQPFKGRKNNTWEVKDGILHCKAVNEQVTGDGDERADIMTTDTFENFDLVFDWKISAEGNSGVIFRATEEFEQPYFSGPEYQMIDDAGFPQEKIVNLTGANYGLHATTSKLLKPIGEWNSSRILANGTHIEYWLNGQKVVEYEIRSDDWNKRIAASKWKDSPGYGVSKSGHIDLQDHGSEVWFRKILIKTL